MTKLSQIGLCVVLALSAKLSFATPVLPTTTNLVGWFDASNPNGTPNVGTPTVPNAGVNPSNGGSVSTWNNLAPTAQNHGLAAVTTTGGTYDGSNAYTAPTFVTNSAPSQLPTVQFNGLSTSLQATFSTAVSQSDTIFAVWKATDNFPGATPEQYLNDGTSGGRQTVQYDTPTDSSTAGPRNALLLYAGGVSIFSAANFTFGAPIEETVVVNGSSSTISANTLAGNLASASGTVSTDGLNGLTLGSRFARNGGTSFVLNGYIAEFLVYQGTLSPGDTAAIQTYLEQKWLAVVPEPSSVVLAMLGLCGLIAGGLHARTRRSR